MRRGAVYTLVSVILLFAVAALFFAHSMRTGHDIQAAVSDRVHGVDAFVTKLDEDSRRAARIAGFRALIAMEQHVTSEGEYFVEPDDAFREIFLTGNYSGTPFVIMENSTFEQYLARVQQEARTQGVLFNASVMNVTLWQASPWAVLVNYTLAFNVTDVRGTASWRVERTFTGEVPVYDLRDPVFSVETLARVQRTIKPSNVSSLVDDVGDANDTSGLMEAFNQSYYFANGRGPSILMRFAGDFSDSPFGIESLIDINELTDQGIVANTTATVVDYRYFTGVTATACSIQNTTSRLKLGDQDLVPYEIQGKLTYAAC